MPSSIIQRTIASATETAISMSNSCWSRPVTIPAGWNKLRVGCRLHLTDFGADAPGTPRFGFGLCKGSTNILGDATTDHFVGCLSTNATWTYSAGSNCVYYNVTLCPMKMVGTTQTLGTALNADYRFPFMQGSILNRYIMLLDITKGSPNYTINVFAAIASVPADQTATTFNSLMPMGTPTLTGFGYGTAQTLAVNEGTDGVLDSVNFWWNRADFTLELCDVAMSVLS